jgi:hypothetical protein
MGADGVTEAGLGVVLTGTSTGTGGTMTGTGTYSGRT